MSLTTDGCYYCGSTAKWIDVVSRISTCCKSGCPEKPAGPPPRPEDLSRAMERARKAMFSEPPVNKCQNCLRQRADLAAGHCADCLLLELDRALHRRDSWRDKAEHNVRLRRELADLLGTDDIEQAVATVRRLRQMAQRMEDELP